MLLDLEQSQLVLIDYQFKLMPAIFEQELILANAIRLATAAKLFHMPIWATEQNPAKLGPNPVQISSAATQTLSKMYFSGVAEGLGEWLRPPAKPQPPQRGGGFRQGGNSRSMPKHLQNRPQQSQQSEQDPEDRSMIVIAGCEAHVCLLQTALELLEEDFEVWVVTDACSSRTERNRDAAFDRLASVGAELVTTEMVIFEWLRTAEHDAFKNVLPLIK